MSEPASTSSPEAPQTRLLRRASLASPAAALLLVLLKGWAWQATGAVSMLASLADSLLDLVASLLTVVAIRVALTPPDERHRFGHGKSEAVASLVQALLIAASALYVVVEAFARLGVPGRTVQVPAVGVTVMAVSVVVTAALIAFQRWAAARTGSMALRADEAHYRTDLLLAVAVALGTWVGARPAWHWVDPAVGLLAAAYLVATASGIVRRALRDLLDEEWPPQERARAMRLVCSHRHVRGAHDLRTRTSGWQRFLQVHAELDPSLTLAQAHTISEEIAACLRREFGALEVMIHLDPAVGTEAGENGGEGPPDADPPGGAGGH